MKENPNKRKNRDKAINRENERKKIHFHQNRKKGKGGGDMVETRPKKKLKATNKETDWNLKRLTRLPPKGRKRRESP